MKFNVWPHDPKDKKPSVSLGILVIATVCMLVVIGLSLTGKAKDTSLVTEWWFGSAALYFGRRMTFGKGLEVGQTDEEKK